jgi:hypothetical protein
MYSKHTSAVAASDKQRSLCSRHFEPRVIRRQHAGQCRRHLRDSERQLRIELLKVGANVATLLLRQAAQVGAQLCPALQTIGVALVDRQRQLGAPSAPWLRRFTENGVEVVKCWRENGRYATFTAASEEELENGIFFKDAAHRSSAISSCAWERPA